MNSTILSKLQMKNVLYSRSTAVGLMGEWVFEYSEMLRKMSKATAFGVSLTPSSFSTASTSYSITQGSAARRTLHDPLQKHKIRVKINGCGLLEDVNLTMVSPHKNTWSAENVESEDVKHGENVKLQQEQQSVDTKQQGQSVNTKKQEQTGFEIDLEKTSEQFVHAVNDARYKLHLQKKSAWEKLLGTSAINFSTETVNSETITETKEAVYFRSFEEQMRGLVESKGHQLGLKPWELDTQDNPEKNPLKPESFSVSSMESIFDLENQFNKHQERQKADGSIQETKTFKEVRLVFL